MTLHFGAGWLIAGAVILYLAGVLAGNVILQALYLDAEPSWYMKPAPLLWPITVPLCILYLLIRLLLMPWIDQ